jgi:putative transposase
MLGPRTSRTTTKTERKSEPEQGCPRPSRRRRGVGAGRNTFRLTSRVDADAIKRDIKPIYTAVNADATLAALDDLDEKWGGKYRAMIRLWRNAWNEFIPFLDYDVEIRRVICSTNAIESLNARYRRAVRARGHFPSEQAALNCRCLVTRSLDPAGAGRTRWLNAFAITFGDRWPATENH